MPPAASVACFPASAARCSETLALPEAAAGQYPTEGHTLEENLTMREISDLFVPWLKGQKMYVSQHIDLAWRRPDLQRLMSNENHN